MRDKLEQFSEWNNSKTSSIVKLSLWMIIIIVVVVFVKTGESSSESSSTQIPIVKPTSDVIKSKLKSMISFEEDIVVETDIDEFMHLIQLDDDILIVYNGDKYHKTDFIYKISSNELVYDRLLSDVIYYNVRNISDYLENVDEDYITVYKDDSFLVSYTMFLNDGVPSFELDESTDTVSVVVSGKDEIDKIVIEFQNYYIRKITLNLSNINNIENIEV